jgi:beta-galactosidase
LDGFKLDVPDGKYELTLLFAELLSDKERTALAYDLNGSNTKEQAADRSFDVLINGETVTEALGDDNYLEPERAFSTRYVVNVTGGNGITISFKIIRGESILNGVQVKRTF